MTSEDGPRLERRVDHLPMSHRFDPDIDDRVSRSRGLLSVMLAHRSRDHGVCQAVDQDLRDPDAPIERLMTDIGFYLLQGYHFARPLSEEAPLGSQEKSLQRLLRERSSNLARALDKRLKELPDRPVEIVR